MDSHITFLDKKKLRLRFPVFTNLKFIITIIQVDFFLKQTKNVKITYSDYEPKFKYLAM